MKQIFFLLILIIACFSQTMVSQVIFEAEDAHYSSGKIDDKHPGFTGDGFVDTENANGEYVEWNVYSYKNVNDTLAFRYALGKDELRSMQLIVNDELIDTIDFDYTTEFTNYEYKYAVGELTIGQNTIKLLAINDFGAPNLDHLKVKTDTNLYFEINITDTEGGTVTQTPLTDSILYGTRVKLDAVAENGFEFSGWTGDISGVKNPVAFTLVKDIAVQANYRSNLPAFPGAEGFGSIASGGRGGDVIEVTNLNDSGDGSFRAAISATGARTVVFRVSGTIELESPLSISNGNLTIAGQTAPGDGITVSGYPIKINANNVIIRYIRSRLGPDKGAQDDAINCRGYSNIIIDHCSFSWSVDEVCSFYDNSKVTLQYCVISEALYNSIHEKGEHSYGGIWGGQDVTFHHNLFAHNTSRNPRFCGSRYTNQADQEMIDFRNNVIFNWGFNSIYGAEGGSYNLVNNYFKSGPATSSSVRSRIIAPNASNGENNQPAGIWGTFYVDGNYVSGYDIVNENNWAGVHVSGINKEDIKSYDLFPFDSVTTQTADLAYEHVLAQVGTVLPNRDAVDTRIMQEVLLGKATYGASYGDFNGIIDSPTDVGGWPELESATPPTDTDKDGMPDEWEDANGLDKNNADDRNADMNGDGFTNLETYLNSLVEGYAYIIRPLNFELVDRSDLEVDLQWEDVTDDETGFVLERKVIGGDYEVVANPSANETKYTDNLPAKGEYIYRLASIKNNVHSFYTDSLVVDATVGIKKNSDINFNIYPNPFSDKVNIEFTGYAENNVTIQLSNVIGQVVYSQQILNNKSGQFLVDTHQLSKGVYIATLKSSKGNSTQKLIKQN